MWEESQDIEVRRAELLEAGLIEEGTLAKYPAYDSDELPEFQRDTEECARHIMIWAPICCLVLLCGMGVIGLGWKGIVALFGF